MARFLKFCKTLPEGVDLRSAMEGYGRYLKSSVPPPQDWQIEQAWEALRCFQKGTENWHIAAPDAEGRVEVGFRVKTRGAGAEGEGQRAESGTESSSSSYSNSSSERSDQEDLRGRGGAADKWLEKSSRTMKVAFGAAHG